MYGQCMWTLRLLESIGAEVQGLFLEQENLSTIALMKNGRPNSSRSRHIAIRYFFIHDKINEKVVNVIHRPSEELTADLLTKPLVTERFKILRDALLGTTSCACARSVLQVAHERDLIRTRELADTSDRQIKQARVSNLGPSEPSPPAPRTTGHRAEPIKYLIRSSRLGRF
mmetsp:Transcript_18954/g.47633  ORF Transcript_18954/g.47633 Transcript_18954/m.47633 type:complete len:171 (+) Transcript_18954:446-958(+)